MNREGVMELERPAAATRAESAPWVTRTPVRVGFALAVATLFAASYTQPLWVTRFAAPQYPQGLRLEVYLDRVDGDTGEVNILNHYVGMRPVEEMATVERSLALFALLAVCLLAVEASAFRKSFWQGLLALPLILFPVGMLLDLYAWLWYSGHSLDPTSPLGMSVKPFTPKLIGVQQVANFEVTSSLGLGTYLQILGAFLLGGAILVGRKVAKTRALD